MESFKVCVYLSGRFDDSISLVLNFFDDIGGSFVLDEFVGGDGKGFCKGVGVSSRGVGFVKIIRSYGFGYISFYGGRFVGLYGDGRFDVVFGRGGRWGGEGGKGIFRGCVEGCGCGLDFFGDRNRGMCEGGEGIGCVFEFLVLLGGLVLVFGGDVFFED